GGGVEADQPRLEPQDFLAQASEARRRSNDAVAIRLGEDGVATGIREHLEPIGNQSNASRAETFGDGFEAMADLVVLFLGGEEEARSLLGIHAEPLRAGERGRAE